MQADGRVGRGSGADSNEGNGRVGIFCCILVLQVPGSCILGYLILVLHASSPFRASIKGLSLRERGGGLDSRDLYQHSNLSRPHARQYIVIFRLIFNICIFTVDTARKETLSEMSFFHLKV
jgi:hypothetical protein